MENEQYVQVMNANAKAAMNGSMGKFAPDGYPAGMYQQQMANGYLPGQNQPMALGPPSAAYDAQAAAAGSYFMQSQPNNYHLNNAAAFGRFPQQHGLMVNSPQNSASANTGASGPQSQQQAASGASRPASNNSLTHDGRSSDSNASLAAYPPQPFPFQNNMAPSFAQQLPPQAQQGQFPYVNGNAYQNGSFQYGAPQNFAGNFQIQNAPANYAHQVAPGFSQQPGAATYVPGQQNSAQFGHQPFTNGPSLPKSSSAPQFAHAVPNGFTQSQPQPPMAPNTGSGTNASANVNANANANANTPNVANNANGGARPTAIEPVSPSESAQPITLTKHSPDMIEKLRASVGSDPIARSFMDRYLQFLEKTNEPLTGLPKIAKQTLNLYRLYETVRNLGGMQEVIKRKKWKEVGAGLLENVAASTALRRAYCKYLFAFECYADRSNQDPRPILEALEAQLQAKRARVREWKGRKDTGKPDGSDAVNGSSESRRRSRTAKADSDDSDDELTNDNEESLLSAGHAHTATTGDESQSQPAVANGARNPDQTVQQPLPAPSANHAGPALANQPVADPLAASRTLACQSPSAQQAPAAVAPTSVSATPAVPTTKWSGHTPPPGSSFLAHQLMHSPTPSENGSLNHAQPVGNSSNQPHSGSSGAAPPQSQPTAMSHLQSMLLSSNGPSTPTSTRNGPSSVSTPAAPSASSSTPQSASRKSRSPSKKSASKKEREAQKRAEANAAAAAAAAAAGATPQPQPQPLPPAAYGYPSGTYTDALINGDPLKAEAEVHEQPNGMMQHSNMPMPGGPQLAGRMDMTQLLNGRQPPMPDGHQNQLAPSGLRMDSRSYMIAKSLVENTPLTSSTTAKRRKLTQKEVGQVDAFRLFMALKSGMLAEVTGALNTLSVLLADDRCLDYFSLRNWPGLLDLLVELACRFLYEMFADRCFSSPNNSKRASSKADSSSAAGAMSEALSCLLERTAHVVTRLDAYESPHCRLFASSCSTAARRNPSACAQLDGTADAPTQSSDNWSHLKQAAAAKTAVADSLVANGVNCENKVDCEMKTTEEDATSTRRLDEHCADEFETLRSMFRKACCSSNRCTTSGCDGLCNAKRRRLDTAPREELLAADSDDLNEYDCSAAEEDVLVDDFAIEEPDWLDTLSDAEQLLADRCTAVMLVLRNLSFVTENHLQLATHSGLLSLCATILLSLNLRPAKALPNPNPNGAGASANARAGSIQSADHLNASSAPDANRFDMRWADTAVSLRESALVLLSNVAPRLDLSRHEDTAARTLISALLRWFLSESAIAVDSFQFHVALPHACSPLHTPNAATYPVCNIGPSSVGLSAQRLALEIICRLCLQSANIDLLLTAVGGFDQKRTLVERVLSRLCAYSQTTSAPAYMTGPGATLDEAAAVQREFLLILLVYLVASSSDFAQFVLICDKERAFLVLFDYLDAAFAIFSHPHAMAARGPDAAHHRVSADLTRRCLVAVSALVNALRVLSPRRAAGVMCRLETRLINYAFTYDRMPILHHPEETEQHAEIRRLLADLLLRCRDLLVSTE